MSSQPAPFFLLVILSLLPVLISATGHKDTTPAPVGTRTWEKDEKEFSIIEQKERDTTIIVGSFAGVFVLFIAFFLTRHCFTKKQVQGDAPASLQAKTSYPTFRGFLEKSFSFNTQQLIAPEGEKDPHEQKVLEHQDKQRRTEIAAQGEGAVRISVTKSDDVGGVSMYKKPSKNMSKSPRGSERGNNSRKPSKSPRGNSLNASGGVSGQRRNSSAARLSAPAALGSASVQMSVIGSGGLDHGQRHKSMGASPRGGDFNRLNQSGQGTAVSLKLPQSSLRIDDTVRQFSKSPRGRDAADDMVTRSSGLKPMTEEQKKYGTYLNEKQKAAIGQGGHGPYKKPKPSKSPRPEKRVVSTQQFKSVEQAEKEDATYHV